MIDYRPKHKVIDVDVATNTLKFEFNDDFKAAVLNVIPNQSAGSIAVKTGLATANNRWCEVDFLTFESKAQKNNPCAGRRHPDCAAHAQVGPHGQPARQDLCRRRGVAAAGQGAAGTADLREHLLQLRHRLRRGARGQRAPLRRREEDHAHRAGLGWSVGAGERAGRPVRHGLGPQHLGRPRWPDLRRARRRKPRPAGAFFRLVDSRLSGSEAPGAPGAAAGCGTPGRRSRRPRSVAGTGRVRLPWPA